MADNQTKRNASVEKIISLHACNVLADLRKSGHLCDAVIQVTEGSTFPVHKNILSACSPYFRALFTNEGFGGSKTMVTLQDVSAEVVSILIDYAYTRDVSITADNVEELLPAADRFHILGLLKACCRFLEKELTPENCIGIWQFAKAYFCQDLAKTAFKYILANFSTMSLVSKEYLKLDADLLSEILSSDFLNIKCEEEAFNATIRWADYAPRQRMEHMNCLLRSMRLGLLSQKFLEEKIQDHKYINPSEECQKTISQALKFLKEPTRSTSRKLDGNNPIARPRFPHEVMFAIGGWSGGSPTNLMESYNSRTDCWTVCPASDNCPRAYHSVVALHHLIYMIGGFDGLEYFSSVRIFNTITKLWCEGPPMHCKRCYVSCSLLDGYIYALGGFDGYVRHNSAERFNPKTNQWSLIHPMNDQRSDASATTALGKIYICGGFDGHACLQTAECFDPKTHQWTLLAPMHNRRSGLTVIAYRDKIYALGGFNGLTRMSSVESYTISAGQWSNSPDMFTPRSNFAVEVIDDMLFAIGGFNGITTISEVECYDASTNLWYKAGDMSLPRSALSACVLRGLQNVEDFIFTARSSEEEESNSKVETEPRERARTSWALQDRQQGRQSWRQTQALAPSRPARRH